MFLTCNSIKVRHFCYTGDFLLQNNVINAFIQMEQTLMAGKYTAEDQLMIACPSAEQVSVLICSVSLAVEQDTFGRTSHLRRSSQASYQQETDSENVVDN